MSSQGVSGDQTMRRCGALWACVCTTGSQNLSPLNLVPSLLKALPFLQSQSKDALRLHHQARCAPLSLSSPSTSPSAQAWLLFLSAHCSHHVGMVGVAEGRVYRRGRGEHVSSMAERLQMAHGHVTGQRSGTERRVLVVQAFSKLFVGVAAPLALFRFVGHLPVACLYPFLFHGEGPVHLQERKEEWGECLEGHKQ